MEPAEATAPSPEAGTQARPPPLEHLLLQGEDKASSKPEEVSSRIQVTPDAFLVVHLVKVGEAQLIHRNPSNANRPLTGLAVVQQVMSL